VASDAKGVSDGHAIESWLHMQASYDLWTASQKKGPLKVERIKLVA
jgi:plasmid maintenance system antidote protein VapI